MYNVHTQTGSLLEGRSGQALGSTHRPQHTQSKSQVLPVMRGGADLVPSSLPDYITSHHSYSSLSSGCSGSTLSSNVPGKLSLQGLCDAADSEPGDSPGGGGTEPQIPSKEFSSLGLRKQLLCPQSQAVASQIRVSYPSPQLDHGCPRSRTGSYPLVFSQALFRVGIRVMFMDEWTD